MTQTKAELVEELESQATKADLVELLRSRLLKDDLAKLLEDESGATKDELVHKLESLKKDELVEAVASHLTKEQIQQAVGENGQAEDAEDEDETASDAESDEDATDERGEADEERQEQAEPARFESHEPDWPRPAPFGPGQRVRVDLSGLPMMGIYAGPGSSAAGTIVDVDPRARQVQVYLDAVFDGEKEIVVPPERLVREG